ncbi:hypothetical protein [Rugosimonospora africana]|uniref:Uncharacterized protein n=1 Tax=Rugosimonospora africana TaxID=556532 RepID=A0A8J3QTS1_9ACTN|nr:hypothetical protein [Rugosimonospora africana]GIH14706.1 hypothetical protein Raf01_28780 [Rugosimonospora africana]
MSKNTANPRLTPDPRRRVVENDEFAAFARRIVLAYGRRVAAGDIEALADLIRLGDAVETATREAVMGLRKKWGYSWTEIATRLRISRQGAQQRWGGDDQ